MNKIIKHEPECPQDDEWRAIMFPDETATVARNCGVCDRLRGAYARGLGSAAETCAQLAMMLAESGRKNEATAVWLAYNAIVDVWDVNVHGDGEQA